MTTLLKLLTIAGCYVVVLWPTGWLIGRLTRRWREEVASTGKGLERGGLWIGCLERVLALTFILLGEYQAIGLLVTAKSILRFGTLRGGDPRSDYQRKLSEYIIIGTLLSFVLVLPPGLCARWTWTSIEGAGAAAAAQETRAIRKSTEQTARGLRALRTAVERLTAARPVQPDRSPPAKGLGEASARAHGQTPRTGPASAPAAGP